MARLAARETARMALAPRFLLSAVASSTRMAWSMAGMLDASIPTRPWAISRLTRRTAVITPLPFQSLSTWSRSSTASRLPVDAPEGTEARPAEPSSKVTAHSTVGLPRLSMICRACTDAICCKYPIFQFLLCDLVNMQTSPLFYPKSGGICGRHQISPIVKKMQ